MPLLSDDDRQEIEKLFTERLTEPVTVHFFTQGASPLPVPSHPCQTCRETGDLLAELSELSNKIKIVTHDLVAEADEAKRQGIERVPALIFEGKGRGKVRYFGIPAGYEFAVLLEALLDASRGTTSLSPATKEQLAKLPKPVHLEVLVTPT
jgi:alkyl hydroperoxide reductase subunit AhpF